MPGTVTVNNESVEPSCHRYDLNPFRAFNTNVEEPQIALSGPRLRLSGLSIILTVKVFVITLQPELILALMFVIPDLRNNSFKVVSDVEVIVTYDVSYCQKAGDVQPGFLVML